MGDVHRIHPSDFDTVNAVAIRLEGLTLRLSFLSKITGENDYQLRVTDREYTAVMEALATEARAITEQVCDTL